MRGVQKCTCAGASLRGRNSAPLCCINLDTATDPFLGSGSTLIACCETDRVCRGIELDPKFVDVIVKRYLAWCQEKQTAEVAYVLRDGQKLSYEEVVEAMPQDGEANG